MTYFSVLPKRWGVEMSNMYNLIEQLCKDNGINMTQMCRDAGIPRGNLTDLKMGRTAALSTKTLGKIAYYFNLPIDYFLDGGEGIPCVVEKKEPANDGELSKKQLMLIDYVRGIPADKVDLALRVMRSIVEDDE